MCEHPPNSHVRLQGLRDESGAFASRATAQYPSKLAQHFATLVAPLLHTPAFDLQWSSVNTIMPIKSLSDYPFAQIDGGGAFHILTGVRTNDKNKIGFMVFALRG